MATIAKKAAKPAAVKAKRPKGRPPVHDKEFQKNALCKWLESGNSLLQYCKVPGNPCTAFFLDLLAVDAVFASQYARAREVGADAICEGLDDVSDAAVRAENAVEVAGLRLKADNIKWKLSKLAPKKYGDRLNVDATVEAKITTDSELIAQLAQLGLAVKATS